MDLHLLQKDVARQLAVNVETLKNWERGVGKPMIRHWPKVIAFLGYDPIPEPETLPERIAHSRRRLGMTQARLAHALEVDSVTIWRWERGDCVPPKSVLARIDHLLTASNC